MKKENIDQTRKIALIILKIIGMAGMVMVVASSAPSQKQISRILREVMAELKKRGMTGEKQDKYYVGKSIKRFIAQGDLVVNSSNILKLTRKGEHKLRRFELNDAGGQKPAHWDGKFRVIIFDIEVGKNSIRDSVRYQLNRWGFVRLQNSVWVYPYDCEEYITLLKTYFGVVKDLVYMTVETIENDAWLKEKFGLK